MTPITAVAVAGIATAEGQNFLGEIQKGRQIEYSNKMMYKQEKLAATAKEADRLSSFNDNMASFSAISGQAISSKRAVTDRAYGDLKADQDRAATSLYISRRRYRNKTKAAKANSLMNAITGLVPELSGLTKSLGTTKTGTATKPAKIASKVKVGTSKSLGAKSGASKTGATSKAGGGKLSAIAAWSEVGMNSIGAWIASKSGSTGW